MFVSADVDAALLSIGDAISHEVRIKILGLLLENESMHMAEIARQLHVAKAGLYHHFQILLKHNLIRKDKQGRRNYYSLSLKGWNSAVSLFEKVYATISYKMNPIISLTLDFFIGMHIRKARQERSVSSQELAEKLSVPAEEVRDWENGNEGISEKRMQRIAAALETDVNGIIGAASIRDFRQKLNENPDFLAACVAEYSRCFN